MQKPIFVNFEEMPWTPHPTIAGIETKFLQHQADFAPSDLLIAQVKQAGEIPWHIHEQESEIAYLLQGKGILYTSETEAHAAVDETALAAGAAVIIPPGLWHSVVNTGEEVIFILAFHA